VEASSARATLKDRDRPPIDHDLVMLAVPDGAIAELALSLRGSALTPASAVVHLSGALDLSPLEPLRQDGHAVGSLHPLRPFPTALPPAAFLDATIAIDASSDGLLATLSAMAQALGARPKPVPAGQRATYHAAAVMASTYLVVLAEQAVRLLSTIGWEADEALSSLLPLIRGTVENLASEGLPNALTGPLRRGDVETVAAHLAALGADPQLRPTLELYRQLGRAGVKIAQQLGLSELDAERISDELQATPDHVEHRKAAN
jgi:predicted short-subunit dehydrogenase-like oxidoreductase (DUF2520 family)